MKSMFFSFKSLVKKLLQRSFQQKASSSALKSSNNVVWKSWLWPAAAIVQELCESRWTSWAVRPNEPSGFRGRKDLLNRASALVTTCP